MNVITAIQQMKEYAIDVYGHEYAEIIENIEKSIDIMQPKYGSIRKLAIKAGISKKDANARTICNYKINRQNNNIYKFIIIPKTRKEDELYYYLAHELFGHAIGNINNIIQRDSEGNIKRLYSGFAYKDLNSTKFNHLTLCEGFALYIESAILDRMGIKSKRGYNTRGEIIAEQLVNKIMEKSSVKRKILNSYINKDEDIENIINITQISEMLDYLNNPNIYSERTLFEQNIIRSINNKILCKM